MTAGLRCIRKARKRKRKAEVEHTEKEDEEMRDNEGRREAGTKS